MSNIALLSRSFLVVVLAGTLSWSALAQVENLPDFDIVHPDYPPGPGEETNPVQFEFDNTLVPPPNWKWFEYTGTLLNPHNVAYRVNIFFDWIDADGNKQFSPPWEFVVPANGQRDVRAFFKLDFCPERVSIHFHVKNLAFGDRIGQRNGVFTHECRRGSPPPNVPTVGEWGMIVIAGGILCIAGWSVMRRA